MPVLDAASTESPQEHCAGRRGRSGRQVPWYELPEEVAGTGARVSDREDLLRDRHPRVGPCASASSSTREVLRRRRRRDGRRHHRQDDRPGRRGGRRAGTPRSSSAASAVVDADGLAALNKFIADAGFYPYQMTPEEMAALRDDPAAVTELFRKLMNETLSRWIDTGRGPAGRHRDPVLLRAGQRRPALRRRPARPAATSVVNPDGRVVELPGGFPMISRRLLEPDAVGLAARARRGRPASRDRPRGGQAGRPAPGDLQPARAAEGHARSTRRWRSTRSSARS